MTQQKNEALIALADGVLRQFVGIENTEITKAEQNVIAIAKAALESQNIRFSACYDENGDFRYVIG